MFSKTLVDNEILIELFCKEYSHIKSYHTGDLYRNVRCFNEIYGEASISLKNDIKSCYSIKCDGLIYEYMCLINQMKRYQNVLKTLIGSSKEEIKRLENLKEEILKL